MRWIPFLLLFGCPVEPKDVQDLNQGNNGKNPQNQMSGAGNGQPPSQPQQNGGGQGTGGAGIQGTGGAAGAGIQGTGGAGTQGAGGQPPVQEADAIPLPPENGTAGAQNLNGDGDGGLVEGGGEGTNPTPNVANEGQAGTPPDVPASSNLLPMYNQLPQFTDIITGDTVSITLTVSGATSFEFEFVVKREGDGRIYPKVLHKESGATSPTIITSQRSIVFRLWRASAQEPIDLCACRPLIADH